MYLNGDSCLLILVSGENLGFLGWDNGVPGDQLGHYSTNGFNTQSKGSHIQEEDICNQYATGLSIIFQRNTLVLTSNAMIACN
uniref:Heat shock cognate 70 kDa-like protein n=1 Tax=Rhizophora mucronata TaxID=61149 RepID=A0A2P2M7R0_RHIMU